MITYKNKIWVVDAFTDVAYRGNPAAVMLVDDFPQSMQPIAKEINLSETAFVKPLKKNRFHIRWFSPTTEAKLCGHATLASAHILSKEKMFSGNKILFDSLSGELSVYKTENFYSLDFPLQKIGKKLSPKSYQKAFQLNDEIIEVFQVNDDVLIRVNSEDMLMKLKPDFNKLIELNARGIIVTSLASQYDFVSRFFAPKVGINEDPVTGSAHCKLADYWNKQLGKSEFKAYQASERGGVIDLKIIQDRVLLCGKAVTVFEGKWLV